jgi:hypothetical protein
MSALLVPDGGENAGQGPVIPREMGPIRQIANECQFTAPTDLATPK